MSAASDRLYHRLQLAAHRLRKRADRALGAAVGLTTAQVAVLSALAEGGTSQRAVARALGLNESALTPMVGRLMRKQLVARRRDEGDVRAWRLMLTGQGREALARCRAPFTGINAALDGALDEAEIRVLVGYLDRVIAALD